MGGDYRWETFAAEARQRFRFVEEEWGYQADVEDQDDGVTVTFRKPRVVISTRGWADFRGDSEVATCYQRVGHPRKGSGTRMVGSDTCRTAQKMRRALEVQAAEVRRRGQAAIENWAVPPPVDLAALSGWVDEGDIGQVPAELVCPALASLLPDDLHALAAVAEVDVPLAEALAAYTGLPLVPLRVPPRGRRTRAHAHVDSIVAQEVALVAGEVSQGRPAVRAVNQLVRRGGTVEYAVCVADREAGGREELAATGVGLRALFIRTKRSSVPGPF